MLQNIDKQEKAYRMLPLFTLINLVSSIIHYCKPDFYWNSPRKITLKHSIGEQATDILGYVTIIGGFAIILIVFLTKIWSKKEHKDHVEQ